jgi:hypothetical protein
MMTDHKALLRAYTAIARREQKERIAKGLAVVKAAKNAGLPVKAANIDGVEIEFGEPEAAGEEAILTPLEAWKAKRARSA